MRRRLRISERALNDIRQALAFTLERFGPQQQAEYKSLIREAIKQISRDPFGVPAKPRPDVHPDAWTMHLSRRGKRARHLFVYQVIDEHWVGVARMPHDAMDLSRIPDLFDPD